MKTTQQINTGSYKMY